MEMEIRAQTTTNNKTPVGTSHQRTWIQLEM